MREVKELSLKFGGKILIVEDSGFCLSKCLFVQLRVAQTDLQEIQKYFHCLSISKRKIAQEWLIR